ncbi:two-component system response regulator YesN [Paenibacillus cellulosilyticus]|uniref:Two-component system response regulator YesN n=1 Tax=Paenibacillus cellulosilyticus TaxID=375489 RepID=A0A2V2YSG5_9BACL|nr:response regulator [Paenibacillus cellulosilyticus]PWW00862.1 two-component system response regulator YesN [Paenibacillus cellulosilyticus]QKS47527.1 response regulator [Paenibacillus cellulosilyticus]
MYKMLIVEDERWEREGLVDFLDWGGMGISEIDTAVDGIDGFEKAMQGQPDIVITDIQMPGMNGIEMANRIKDRLPAVRIVVLTGYDDFNFARDALRFGAVDYVLKPVEEEEMLSTMARVIQSCDKERLKREEESQLQQRLLVGERAVLREMVADVLNGNGAPHGEAEQRLIFSEGLASDAYAIYAIRLPISIIRDAAVTEQWIGQAMERQILVLTLDTETAGVNALAVLLPLAIRELGSIRELADRLRSALLVRLGEETASSQLFIGIADEAAAWSELGAACQQAVSALQYGLFANAGGKLIGYREAETARTAFATERESFMRAGQEHVRAIRLHAAALEEAKAEEALRDLFGLFRSHRGAGHVYAGSLLDSVLNELALLDEQLAEHKAQRLQELLAIRPLSELHHDTMGMIRDVMERLRGKRSNKDDYIIGKVIALIEKSYGSTELNLTMASQEVFVSPNHLGMLFKKSTGRSLGEYLQEYRLNKAEELLRTTKQKVASIAERVGIPNTSYFGTLFKQAYGMTPSEYQELAQRR